MSIRFFLFGVVGFAVGILTMMASGYGPQIARERTEQKASANSHIVTNEEFEAVERQLRDPRDRDWNLLQDMQPCFPGSRLCFLLSGRPARDDRGTSL